MKVIFNLISLGIVCLIMANDTWDASRHCKKHSLCRNNTKSDNYNLFLHEYVNLSSLIQRSDLELLEQSPNHVMNLTHLLLMYDRTKTCTIEISESPANCLTSQNFEKFLTFSHEFVRFKKLFNVSLDDFNLLYPIGKGGFGTVWKCEHKTTKKIYAMKQMFKAKIIYLEGHDSINLELKMLSHLKHPLITNIEYAFQDNDFLYQVMDYLPGGDLRNSIEKYKFEESEVKFFVSCIVLALDYLHTNGVLHKDIKPRNLMFDSLGYLHLVDFGLAKLWFRENFEENGGTYKYMAPEILCYLNHGIASDYYSIGVILYELMFDKYPYSGKNRTDLVKKMIYKPKYISLNNAPAGWSPEAVDFINQLLKVNQTERLGYYGFEQVKKHKWLEDVQWENILNKSFIPHFIPNEFKEFTHNATESVIKDLENEEIKKIYDDENIQKIFYDYYYDANHYLFKGITNKQVKERQSFSEKNFNNTCT